MDDLEKLIRGNKEAFNQAEPNPDVWNRISKERAASKKEETKVVKMPNLKWLKVAASVVILALATFGAFNLFNEQKEEIVSTKSPLPQDIIEMDRYYEKQVKVYLTRVEEVVPEQEIIDDIKQELEELDKEKKQLYNEFGQETDDKIIVEALISTYRMKLQILEDILSLLNENEETEDLSI